MDNLKYMEVAYGIGDLRNSCTGIISCLHIPK